MCLNNWFSLDYVLKTFLFALFMFLLDIQLVVFVALVKNKK